MHSERKPKVRLHLAAGMTVVLWAVCAAAAAQPKVVTSNDLLERDAHRLTGAELASLMHSGAAITHVAPSTGNVRRWVHREDGTFTLTGLRADVSFQGFPYNATGTYHVLADGTYCVTITFRDAAEDWCRYIYRLDGSLYLVPMKLTASGAQWGRIEIN